MSYFLCIFLIKDFLNVLVIFFSMHISIGCIPIYHGPTMIFDIFNKDAFVFYNISEPEKSLGHVKDLNENHELYESMLASPILANGQNTIEKYFSFDESIGNGYLKKEIRKKLGLPWHDLATS